MYYYLYYFHLILHKGFAKLFFCHPQRADGVAKDEVNLFYIFKLFMPLVGLYDCLLKCVPLFIVI